MYNFVSLSGNIISNYTSVLSTALKNMVLEPASSSVSPNLFECSNLEYIQLTRVCDGRLDCLDGSDENNCCKIWVYIRHHSEQEYNILFDHHVMQHIQLIPGWEVGIICETLTINVCHMYIPASTCPEQTFECDDGQCIDISLYCDYIKHCPDGSDEAQCGKPLCISQNTHHALVTYP